MGKGEGKHLRVLVLAHGKDPEIRKLAESVIRDQEKEVAMMQDWLKKNRN